MPAPTAAYEDRIIMFIDFLGFKEIVEGTLSDPQSLQRLVSALHAIGDVGYGNHFSSQRVSQFSDSVVISYRLDERSGAFWMINSMALTVITLVGSGYLLRGAITVGKLYHDGKHVVGPAMNAAYMMESKIANYPRVIVDRSVVKAARQWRSPDHSPSQEEEFVRSFLSRDDDGELYFDYVSWEKVVDIAGGTDALYGEYLAGISAMLDRGLRHESPSVREKYLWLHQHYLAALDVFRDMTAESGYRIDSPENCSIIEALPRLEELASAARGDSSKADEG